VSVAMMLPTYCEAENIMILAKSLVRAMSSLRMFYIQLKTQIQKNSALEV